MQVGQLVRHILYPHVIGVVYRHVYDDRWLVQWNDGVQECIGCGSLEVLCK